MPVRHWPYRSGMADGPSDPGSPKPPPEVLRELTPTGRRRFVFAGWEETPGGYRSLIELSTEAADDPAGLARAFLEALRTSDLLGGEPGEPTGWRMVHGTHGLDYVPDPEGRDTPPAGLPRAVGRAAGAPAPQRARRARRGGSRDPRAGDRRHPRAARPARWRTIPSDPRLCRLTEEVDLCTREPVTPSEMPSRSGPTRRSVRSATCCSCPGQGGLDPETGERPRAAASPPRPARRSQPRSRARGLGQRPRRTSPS